jgi:uncharacterized protein involved in cysteine biosynthesis
VLVLNDTPLGNAPLSLKLGPGFPLAVTVNVPAVPTVNVPLFPLLICGATVFDCTVKVKF